MPLTKEKLLRGLLWTGLFLFLVTIVISVEYWYFVGRPQSAARSAFAQKLDKASDLIVYQSFGTSGENRDLPLLIASNDKTFTVESARKKGKAIILIQACIHAGESDGKDAGLALLRDIAITRTMRASAIHSNR